MHARSRCACVCISHQFVSSHIIILRMSDVFCLFVSFEPTLLATLSRRRLDCRAAESSQQSIDFKVSRQRPRSRGETGTWSSDGPLTRQRELQAEQSRWRERGNQNMLLPARTRKREITYSKDRKLWLWPKRRKPQIIAVSIFYSWFVSCCWFIVALVVGVFVVL